jgi:hypothetical protein
VELRAWRQLAEGQSGRSTVTWREIVHKSL